MRLLRLQWVTVTHPWLKKRSQSPLETGHIDPQVGSESPKSRVIESIYTPTTPIKILLSDTDRVKRLKNDIGVLTIDNWLEDGLQRTPIPRSKASRIPRAHLDGLSNTALRV